MMQNAPTTNNNALNNAVPVFDELEPLFALDDLTERDEVCGSCAHA